ncbi:MAG: hypothetical protein SGJ15_07995 [Bacteroidota bacterium]|nr:hypothetical protein [Bacteroidota bacterium]
MKRINPLDLQFEQFLKIVDTNVLLKYLASVDGRDIIILLEHLPRMVKAKLLIDFEEYLAIEDKKTVKYEFENIKEKLLFLKNLEERIRSLIEIKQISQIHPAYLNLERINVLLDDLRFCYAIEGGIDPGIINNQA